MDFTHQGSRDVWLLDLFQRTLTRVTFDTDGHDPVWSPDGRLAYASARRGNIGIFMANLAGGEPDSVFVGETAAVTAGAFTPDGENIVAIPLGAGGNWDLSIIPTSGAGAPEPLMATQFNDAFPSVSPDGRWLAYQSDESGQFEVYVRPFDGRGGKVLVSLRGGDEPVWSRDGRELFYRGVGTDGAGNWLIVARVRTDPTFEVVSRTPLFEVRAFEPAAPHANYDVSPDGEQFVMVHQGQLSRMILIQNWIEEVRARGGGAR